MRTVLLLGATIGPCAISARLEAQTPHPIGIYELISVGTQQLPAIGSRIIAYEGATLHSARLVLNQAGELQGHIVVSFTDSGTVTDTMLVAGRWEQHGDTLRFTYEYSHARWQGGPRSYQRARPVSAVLAGVELTLPDFAAFDERFFGEATPLHFRRVD